MEKLLEKAEDRLITGEFDKSLEIINQIIEEEPSERAYYLRGYLYYCKYEYEKAIPELKYVTENYPENEEANYYLSQIYSSQGDYKLAKEYIERALKCDTENIDYLGDFVTIEQALKNFDHCIELCDILIDETPDSNFALNARGYSHMRLGNIEQAIQDFKTNTKANPTDFMAWNNLGVAYLKMKDHDHAKDAFKHALRQNPGFSDSYANMGYLFFKEENMDKGFLYLNKALEIDPENADAYKMRAELHIAEGDKSEARADLIKADDLGYSYFFDDQVSVMLENLEK